MNTMNQHYVPRVYLNSWKTKTSTFKNPSIIFDGVNYFKNNEQFANGTSVEAILYEKKLYSVKFEDLIYMKDYTVIKKDFAEKIYDIFQKTYPSKTLYALYNHHRIYNKKQILKYMDSIDEWEFFYQDEKKPVLKK